MIQAVLVHLMSLVAILSGLSAGCLTIAFAISPKSQHNKIHIFPLVAGIVQLCSSVALAISLVAHYHVCGPTKKRLEIILFVLLAILCLISAAILGASLGLSESTVVVKASPVFGTDASTFLNVTFVVLAFSVLANLVCILALIRIISCTHKVGEAGVPFSNTYARPQEMTETSPSITASPTLSNPFQERKTLSTPSSIRSDATSSLRSSFSTTQRPSSSKRRIMLREISHRQSSRTSSFDSPSRRPSQEEDFDSWDTSAVSKQVRETVLHTKAISKGSGLEPIPGSRSPSPAKALEGPFFPTSPSITPPASPLPQPTVSQRSSAPTSPLERPSDLPKFSSVFSPMSSLSSSLPATPRPPDISRPSSRSGPISHAGSVAVPRSRQGSRSRAPSEDHIHPLFRTSSPTPPPSASANTNVTAAPEAGQLINERMLKRMRSGSLPSISSPLMRSESSPDISSIRVPPSPNLGTMPTYCMADSRSSRPHQRKRSASFQGNIDV